MNDGTRIAEANRLYWETDTSVAAIAERFDLSRRALYDAVSPHPAGLACPACGQGLLYENRSARRDGQGTCPGCGALAEVGDIVTEASDAMGEPLLTASAESDGMADPLPDPDLRADARAVADADDARTADLRGRAMLLGGAAIVGVAIGTVAVLFARRRD